MVQQLVKQCGSRWNRGTFKREFALVAFVCWLLFIHLPTILLSWYKDAAIIAAYSANYSIATTMIWGFILSAFGTDWWSKQMKGPTTTLPTGGP